MTSNENIKWELDPVAVWEQFQDNPEQFAGIPTIICAYAFDDIDSKWWLSAQGGFQEGELLLVLENSDDILGSVICTSLEGTVNAVRKLLAEVL